MSRLVALMVGCVLLLPVVGASGCLRVYDFYNITADNPAENGKVVQLRVGQELGVVLEDEYDWTGGFGDGSLFEPASQERMRGQGPEATLVKFNVARTGETTFRLVGVPKCRSSTPRCDTAERVVERKLVVR